ncbi:MAG: trehalose-phosphatase, partial [Dehalococcoidales bacterium]|nr:trehalose-phosphatase [Dehalococcoidales bacterium]
GRPELAVLPEENRQLLCELAHQRQFTVGIISGRALSDLKGLVGVEGIVYAGNHGFEIEGSDWSFISPVSDEIRPLFRVIRQVLSLTLSTIKGVLIEDKGMTLSVHYRQVDEEKASDIKTLVERAVSDSSYRGLFRITAGKKVYEVRPAIDWDKGKAISLLIEKYGKGGKNSGLVPIYMGDDLTDEDGFREIEKYENGITVHVGEVRDNTAARYYLKSTDEVQKFLVEMLEYNQRGLLCEKFSTI